MSFVPVSSWSARPLRILTTPVNTSRLLTTLARVAMAMTCEGGGGGGLLSAPPRVDTAHAQPHLRDGAEAEDVAAVPQPREVREARGCECQRVRDEVVEARDGAVF